MPWHVRDNALTASTFPIVTATGRDMSRPYSLREDFTVAVYGRHMWRP